MKEQEQNITPETLGAELSIIPSSIRIQENKGKFNAMSLAIEYKGLPHMAIAYKTGFSQWLIHAPTAPYIFKALHSTEGIDITTAEKMLEMLGVHTEDNDPAEIGMLLWEKLSEKKSEYERIHAEYLNNSQEKQAYGNAVRAFAEDLIDRWDSKKTTQ